MGTGVAIGIVCPCSYEAEENPGVCAAMERTAELFIAGNIAPEIVEEPPSSAGGSEDQPSEKPA